MYLYTRATEAARTYYILLYTYKLYRYIISLYTHEGDLKILSPVKRSNLLVAQVV